MSMRLIIVTIDIIVIKKRHKIKVVTLKLDRDSSTFINIIFIVAFLIDQTRLVYCCTCLWV